MQSIFTKYMSPTNRRPARVKAQCQAGSVILPWNYALGENGNHAAACEAIRAKLGWTVANGYPVMIGGHSADGMAWVFASGNKAEN